MARLAGRASRTRDARQRGHRHRCIIAHLARIHTRGILRAYRAWIASARAHHRRRRILRVDIARGARIVIAAGATRASRLGDMVSLAWQAYALSCAYSGARCSIFLLLAHIKRAAAPLHAHHHLILRGIEESRIMRLVAAIATAGGSITRSRTSCGALCASAHLISAYRATRGGAKRARAARKRVASKIA